MENQLPTFDFNTEQGEYNKLIDGWKEEANKVEIRRKFRENKKNVEELRASKIILSDETCIADLTINTNIKRQRPAYTNYITQSRRLLLLKDIDNPDYDTEVTEDWFTTGMRYPGWKMPWFRQVDGTLTHGGCAMEVMYDPTKPLCCCVEYIPRESLIFNPKAKSIQSQARILREYEITITQLEEFATTYNFDPVVAKQLVDRFKTDKGFIKIYRILFKKNGIVYNAWYSREESTTWLRAPMPHDIGLFNAPRKIIAELLQTGQWETQKKALMQLLPLKEYPITWFPFDIHEDERLLNTQGRVALDLHTQEAMDNLLTSTVNAAIRASKFYPTAEGEPGDSQPIKELGALKHGSVMQGKIETFQAAWPNAIILSISQLLDQRNSNQTGNTDYAAIARKDANKTATEMNLAVQQSQQLNITELDVFSAPFLNVYALCFEIARQQAIFGLCKPPPSHAQDLLRDYNISPAGDVEVVKREEDKQNAAKFLEVTRGTPLASVILTEMIRKFFPEEADQWLRALDSGDKDAIITQLISIIEQIPLDELQPEQRAALQHVIIAAQNVVGGGNNNSVSPNPGQSPGPVSNGGNESQSSETPTTYT